MNASKKVIVIEDEPDIQEIIVHNLLRDGYQVEATPNGERGLEMVRRLDPDLVLLDLMLPGLDGVEVCRRMKTDPRTRAVSIIMVTARGEESDVVLGLGLGADDYVSKPFSPRELMERVKAVLRRGPLQDHQSRERIVVGDVVIDAGRHEFRVSKRRVDLTASEFRLLHCLASQPGRVFTRDQLLNRVVGEDTFIDDRNIDVHVGAVRRKLGAHKNLVETVRGVGYRFHDDYM
jgi:two-component system phosphate regulon response regulator PhoB